MVDATGASTDGPLPPMPPPHDAALTRGSPNEQDLRVALARRLVVAFLALLGLALTVAGAWFAITLGARGTVTFTSTAHQAALVGANTLNRVSVPVTVTAHAASGPVFLGAATPNDATDAVGQAQHDIVVSAAFPARALQLEQLGTGGLEDPSGYHVWRTTGTDTITLTQDQAPQAVLVYPTQGGPVDISVSYARTAWFLEALGALVVGLVVLAFAGGWLWQHRHSDDTDDADDADDADEPSDSNGGAPVGAPGPARAGDPRPEGAR